MRAVLVASAEAASTTKWWPYTLWRGIPLLSLFLNRLECTILYLEAMKAGSSLQNVDVSDANREHIVELCDRADALLIEYAKTHASRMPDRGSEGTLVSFLNTVPVFVHRLKQRLTGTTSDTKREHSVELPKDAPPSPIHVGT